MDTLTHAQVVKMMRDIMTVVQYGDGLYRHIQKELNTRKLSFNVSSPRARFRQLNESIDKEQKGTRLVVPYSFPCTALSCHTRARAFASLVHVLSSAHVLSSWFLNHG